MNEFKLRRKKAAPPPQAASTPATSGMPFRPGEVILTDAEKRDLKVLNYQAGDPLPGDLPEKIAAHRRLAAEDQRQEIEKVTATGHVCQVPKEVPLDQLPDAHRKSLLKAMEDAKVNIDYAELQRKELAALNQLDPSVRQAVLAARGDDDAGIELFRGGEEEAVAGQASPQFVAGESPRCPTVRAAPRAEPPRLKEKSAPKERPAPPPADEAAKKPATCPHCNWNLDSPDPTEPSAGDVMAYAASLWTDVPFMKVYEFFGGRLRVTFRTTGVLKVETCFTQLSLDARAGRVVGVDDFWRRMYDYRVALALDKVYANGKTIQVGREVDRFLAENPSPTRDVPAENGSVVRVPDGDTCLPELVAQLMASPPMSHESVWRILGVAWKRFNTLVEKLEAKAEDRSFWNAIGG